MRNPLPTPPPPADTAPAPERTRTVAWEDPVEAFAASAGMTGLEYLRAMAAGELPPPPIAMLMGFGIETIEEGRVVFTVEPAEYHYNPIGLVHGGVAATLLDSAMGCAVQSHLPAGVGYTTLEIKVSYVRPMTRDTGPVHGEGTVLHLGRKVATTEARLTDGDGRLLAHATSTCLIMRP